MPRPLLSVRDVGKRFGGLTALSGVSFDVDDGRIVGMMGANGAGKTTLFSLIAGNARPIVGRHPPSTADRIVGVCGPTGSAASAWPAPSRSSSRSRR